MSSRGRAPVRGSLGGGYASAKDTGALESTPNSAQFQQGNAALVATVPTPSADSATGGGADWGEGIGATLAADMGGTASVTDGVDSQTDGAATTEVTGGEAWSGSPPWDQVLDPVALFGSKGSRTEVQKASFMALVEQLSTPGDSDSKLRARGQINKWLDGSVTTAELSDSAVGGISGTKGMGIEAQRRADAFEPGQGADFFEFLVNSWANYQESRNSAEPGELETTVRNGGRHGGLGINYLLDQKYLACVREQAAAEGIALHFSGEDGFYSLNIGQFSEVPLGEYLRVIEYDTSFGKVLGIVGTIASFFPGVGTAIGAFVQGVAAVASGGTLLDGLKAGLGAYMSAGGFGGGAVERLAGSVLQSDGDPMAIGVALLNVGLEGTALQEALEAKHIQITSEGLSITPGGGSLGIELSLGGDVRMTFAVSPDLNVTLEDDGGLGIELTQGDTTLEASTDGTVTLRQDLGGLMGADTRTSFGLSGNLSDGGMSLTGGQTSLASPDGYATDSQGSIDLQTGNSHLDVSHNATLAEARDQLAEHFGTDDRSADYMPLYTNIAGPETDVPDSLIDGNVQAPEMDPGPTIGYDTPETAILHWPVPTTPLEEVHVVAQYLNPLEQVVDTPSHSTPGQGEVDGRDTDSVQEPGWQMAQDAIGAAVTLMAAFATVAGDDAGLGVADSMLALNEALQKAQADPSQENITRLTKAVIDVFKEASEKLGNPSSHSAAAMSKSFGLALDVRTVFDPGAPLEARVDALMRAVTAFHPVARTSVEVYQSSRDLAALAYALANADIARDPSTGRTSIESLFAGADTLKAYVQGAGDWIAESAIEVGELAEDVIAEELGADAASGIADGFERAGEIGEAAADSMAEAGAGLAVIYGALPATIIGATRGVINSLEADEGGP